MERAAEEKRTAHVPSFLASVEANKESPKSKIADIKFYYNGFSNDSVSIQGGIFSKSQ